ncbi:class I SAM-dependent methyltransferase [Planktomarina temperata]|nr:class I SAM-dependent methyltransferase [Planktomarina temperata]
MNFKNLERQNALLDNYLSERLEYISSLKNFYRSSLDEEIHVKTKNQFFELLVQKEYVRAGNLCQQEMVKNPKSITIRALFSAIISIFGRTDEALRISDNLARRFPLHNTVNKIHQDNLFRAGKIKEGVEWIKRELDGFEKSTAFEEFVDISNSITDQRTDTERLLPKTVPFAQKDVSPPAIDRVFDEITYIVRLAEELHYNIHYFVNKNIKNIQLCERSLKALIVLPNNIISDDMKWELVLTAPLLSSAHRKLLLAVRSYKEKYFSEMLDVHFGGGHSLYQSYEDLFIPGLRPTGTRLTNYFSSGVCFKGSESVLDLGCNTGFLLCEIASQIKSGTGVEISSNNVAIANSVSLFHRKSNLTFINEDAVTFLDNCSAKYDVIILCAVHSWIGLSSQELRLKVLSILEPGGVVLLESQGCQSRRLTEAGFWENFVAEFKKSMVVINSGEILDDSRNLRNFALLRAS